MWGSSSSFPQRDIFFVVLRIFFWDADLPHRSALRELWRSIVAAGPARTVPTVFKLTDIVDVRAAPHTQARPLGRRLQEVVRLPTRNVSTYELL